MSADWRTDNVERLRGQRWRWKDYYRRSEDWDHDHCSACSAKFMLRDGFLHQGYAVTQEYQHGADYVWVCRNCFEDLKDLMDWKVAD